MGGPSDEGTCDGGAATRADFLRRLNRTTMARTAYEEALQFRVGPDLAAGPR